MCIRDRAQGVPSARRADDLRGAELLEPVSSSDRDVDAVTALVEHVAATVVAPRFRDLRDGEVREKAPGDVVTVVDTAAEAALVRGLAEIAPGVPVVCLLYTSDAADDL